MTAATGFIREMRGVMREQGSPARKIALMAEMICRHYGLPLPADFIEEPPFEQMRLVYNVPKSNGELI
jgi:hypothetical protein